MPIHSRIPHLNHPPTMLPFRLQVSFFSFVFLCEELREQLEDLHSAVASVLRRLPEC